MKTLVQIADALEKINLKKYAPILDGTADFICLPHNAQVPALFRNVPVAYGVWVKDEEDSRRDSTQIGYLQVRGAYNFVGFREVSNEVYFSRSHEMYFLKLLKTND